VPSSNPRRAFLLVPFIATGIWYVFMLGALVVGNGRLRWKTDVLAMGLGAVIVGFPTALVITVVLAVPSYLFVRQVRAVTIASAVVGGALIGSVSWIVFWALTGELTALSPLRAPLIGMLTAVAWWYAGGRSAADRFSAAPPTRRAAC
jgi:uncharacterized membrane protein YkvI